VSSELLLEIRIRPGDTGTYNVDARVPGGRAEDFSCVLPSPEFFDKLIRLQRGFSRTSDSTRSIDAIQSVEIGPTTLREFGIALFDMLFKDGVKTLYDQLCDATITENRSSRVRLRIRNDVPALSFIPWELMYDKKLRQHISCHQFIHLTRSVDAKDITSKRTLPITILGMAARPSTIDGRVVGFIDADAEQQRITKAFAELEDDCLVDLNWTGSCSIFSLGLRLDRPPKKSDGLAEGWDVFHFIGHGGLDETGNGYVIVQEDGGIGGQFLYADVLAGLLVRPGGPQLVVLSSCSGAQAKPGELFSDTASTLVMAGIPAVLAMQTEITDSAAIIFMTAFYASLSSRKSLQHAITEARNQLKARFPTEWPTPVLYLRGDGRIFEL
jgi:hypothetical protein